MTIPSAALVDAWNAQAEWSSRASQLKRDIATHRTRVLSLTVATAVLGAAGASLSTVADPWDQIGHAAAAAAAIAAGVAGTLQTISRGTQQTEQWNRARAVSEALKEAVYRYLTQTGSYASGDRDKNLRTQTAQLIRGNSDLLAIDVPARTPRVPPAAMDIAEYIEQRITQQIDDYYLLQAKSLAQQQGRWQRRQEAMLYTAAVLGASVSVLPGVPLAVWVGVFTTIAGALAAHIEGARFSHLIVAYKSTANRLTAIRSQAQQELSEGKTVDFDRLVDRAEEAISVENEAWMAAWSGRIVGE